MDYGSEFIYIIVTASKNEMIRIIDVTIQNPYIANIVII